MKPASRITTPEQYLSSLPEGRRQEMTELHEAILKIAPHLKPWIAYGMIGYGKVERDAGNRQPREAPIVSIAAQVRHIRVYLGGHDTTATLDPRISETLGQVSIGGCCIRFKRLADVYIQALLDLIVRICPRE